MLSLFLSLSHKHTGRLDAQLDGAQEQEQEQEREIVRARERDRAEENAKERASQREKAQAHKRELDRAPFNAPPPPPGQGVDGLRGGGIAEEIERVKRDYTARGGKDSSILEAIVALEHQVRVKSSASQVRQVRVKSSTSPMCVQSSASPQMSLIFSKKSPLQKSPVSVEKSPMSLQKNHRQLAEIAAV